MQDFEKYAPYPFLITKNEIDDIFVGQEVVVFKLLEGEKCVLYDNYMHAEKIEIPLQDENWQNIKELIDENMYLCGIKTQQFHLSFIGIENEYLSWQETKEYANTLEMKTLPIFYEGLYTPQIWTNGMYLIRLQRSFSKHESSKMAILYFIL